MEEKPRDGMDPKNAEERLVDDAVQARTSKTPPINHDPAKLVADRIAPPGDSLGDMIRLAPAMASTERMVTLRRTESEPRDIDVLWYAIDAHSEALSFPRYAEFLRTACAPVHGDRGAQMTFAGTPAPALARHIPGADLYAYLKTATEVFLLLNCGVAPGSGGTQFGMTLNADGYPLIEASDGLSYADAQKNLSAFLGHAGNNYLEMVLRAAFPGGKVAVQDRFCLALENEQLDTPCLLELIWSYWMEEGMLNQTIAAITRRFQNVRRAGPGPDPLAELELDPLRPLSGFIWGWLQDEPSRLSVVRRAYEYNHHYGLTLYGRAVPPLRAADPRSRFLEGFHNLLRQASAFYREDNDTTVIADPFPVLNSLREVHLLLAEGAHNQFRDLPWQSRGEMMMQQWLISRPEMREFLRGRHMTAYPEEWMGGVDAMKRLQGWTDTSVRYFRDLAVAGERILLSIRYGPWNDAGQEDARSWLRYWREDVQRYIHAYQTATGVSLGEEATEVRNRTDARYLQPSYHLRNRMLSARRAGTLR